LARLGILDLVAVVIDGVRDRLGHVLFERVAGPEGPGRRRRIHDTPGPRWFDPERPIRVVHGDASMFVGGIRALLLQSLHPLAMAGVAGHSGYRSDPWGRLARTSYFLAVTTFGTASDAQAMVDQIKSIHDRVRGKAPDGRAYSASDPHLLRWVHVAETDSFLAAHDAYGAERLTQAQRDAYVADTAEVASRLGVVDPPRSVAQLHQQLRAFEPELEATDAAREAARFLLLDPPLPWAARPPYALLASAAVGLLPAHARRPLGLPHLPLVERTLVRAAGHLMTRSIRWAMQRPPSADEATSG
jgi:uncharacterized protein (DUF2236 family)